MELNEDLHLAIHQAGPPPGQAHLQCVAATYAEHVAAGLITPKIGNLEATKVNNAEVMKHWTMCPLRNTSSTQFHTISTNVNKSKILKQEEVYTKKNGLNQ